MSTPAHRIYGDTPRANGLASTESEQSRELGESVRAYSTQTSANGDDATPARTITVHVSFGVAIGIGFVLGLLVALVVVNAGLALGALP